MFVVVDGKVAGLVGVADPVKETTVDALRELHQERVQDDGVCRGQEAEHR
jgi:Cu+-exporting ATPase